MALRLGKYYVDNTKALEELIDKNLDWKRTFDKYIKGLNEKQNTISILDPYPLNLKGTDTTAVNLPWYYY